MLNIIHKVLKFTSVECSSSYREAKMKKWNTYTISKFFKFFIIAFVLLPSMMVVAVAFYEFRNTKQEKINHLQDIISMQREVIENWLTDQSFQIRSITELDFVRQNSTQSMNENFTVILKNQDDLSTIAYVNKEGIITAADQPAKIINDNISTRDYFQQAMQGKNYISDVLISRTTNQPMIVFASPVRNITGEIQGIVYGVVRLTRINTLMERFKFGRTGKIYLVSPEGRVIAGSHDGGKVQQSENTYKKNIIKTNFSNFGISQALEGESGNSVYEDYNGKRVLGTYQQIDRTKWAIIGEIDESEILKPFYRQLEFIITIYLLALLFIIPMALLLYKKIIMPLKSLVYGSKAIEMGNYSYQIPEKLISSAPRELQQLCEKFSQMSVTIKNNVELLYETNEILAEAEVKYRNLVENSLVGVYIIQDDLCTYVNPHFASIFGYQQIEIQGIKKIQELITPTDWPKLIKNMQLRLTGEMDSIGYELKGVKQDGCLIDLVTYGSVCTLKGKRAIIGTLIDISERKLMEEKLKYLSFHDQLTGLYNRNYFEEIALPITANNHTTVGIIVCDVDRLKNVNDTLGHQQGDKVLQGVATVLRRCFAENEIVARIGGDEFVVVLFDISSCEIEKIKQQIYDQINTFNLENLNSNLSMSIGVAVSRESPMNISNLFNEADSNMYYEKRKRSERKVI